MIYSLSFKIFSFYFTVKILYNKDEEQLHPSEDQRKPLLWIKLEVLCSDTLI